jgi:16S rRNA processing protein RimM
MFNTDNQAGSMGWTTLARILRPQGRHGELLAEILTDFPESLRERKRLFLKPEHEDLQNELRGNELREVLLEAHWPHKGRIVLKFAGIDSISDAEKLRGFAVVLPREERMPLEGDAVYISDLLGARVIDVGHGDQQDAGEIIDVLPGGIAPDLLVVRTEAPEPLLIPFVKAYLKKIDLAAKRIEMALPAGLTAMQDPLTEEERQRMRQESMDHGGEEA